MFELLYVILSLVLPQCPNNVEDNPNIYWDATECGDGNGTSFVSLGYFAQNEDGDNAYHVTLTIDANGKVTVYNE